MRYGNDSNRRKQKQQPSQYGQNVAGSSSTAYYTMPTSVAERPPPLLYAAHHAHTPHTPHTPHHSGLLYAPAAQSQLYMDILKNREGQQHQELKKKAPQVLFGLSDAVHPHVSSAGVAYAPPRVAAPRHTRDATRQYADGETRVYNPRLPSSAAEPERAEPQHVPQPAPLLAEATPHFHHAACTEERFPKKEE